MKGLAGAWGAPTVLWAVVDVTSSSRHPSACIFLLVLPWAHGSFALHYSQVDVDIIKVNPYSIVGSNVPRKVTFPINYRGNISYKPELSLCQLNIKSPRGLADNYKNFPDGLLNWNNFEVIY